MPVIEPMGAAPMRSMRLLPLHVITMACLATSLTGDPAMAQPCGDNAPATPVPQSVQGQRLWPPSGFRPAQPGQRIPDQRDSTDYRSLTIAGQRSGHELFDAVDIVGDSLYVAYNAGFSIWDISPANAANPARRHVRDGYVGGFPEFPQPGEATHLVHGIGAAEAPDGSVLVALGGAAQVGVTLWRHDGDRLQNIAQNVGSSAYEVEVARVGDRMYAFAGTQNDGVVVFDGETGDRLGSVGAARGLARYLDVLVVDDVAWIISGGSPRVPPTLFALPDPARPENALGALRVDPGPKGVALFADAGRHYMATVRSQTVEIFPLDHCMDADGCNALGAPIWRQPLDETARAVELLTFSRGPDGAPYLYYGIETSGLAGERVERLWDLRDLSAAGRVTEITDGGGSYVDDCGNRVDYWGHYYSGNASGFRNVAPRAGMWHGRHFYRVSVGLLDVHTLPAR